MTKRCNYLLYDNNIPTQFQLYNLLSTVTAQAAGVVRSELFFNQSIECYRFYQSISMVRLTTIELVTFFPFITFDMPFSFDYSLNEQTIESVMSSR